MYQKINPSTKVFFVILLTFNLEAIARQESKSVELPPAYKLILDDLNRIIEKVNSIDRNKDTYMVSPSEVDWLLRAVSKTEREKWARDFFKATVTGKEEFYQKLDALSAACAKNIPGFIPDPSNFINHHAANEEVMKKALPHANIKIHQIGFNQSTWDIQENNLHVPQKRYMIGYVWGKNFNDDYTYCKLYQVRITQEYIGGKYGESKASILDSWLVGCK